MTLILFYLAKKRYKRQTGWPSCLNILNDHYIWSLGQVGSLTLWGTEHSDAQLWTGFEVQIGVIYYAAQKKSLKENETMQGISL